MKDVVTDEELNVFKIHGLYMAHAVLEDEEGLEYANGLYLYQPTRFCETFWVVFSKLAQLNNYCFHQLVSSHSHLSELKSQRDEAKNQRWPSAEELDYYDEQIPGWENNVDVIAKANAIVLLCSFAEWALKTISKELTSEVPRKTSRDLSDIEHLLQHIKENAGLALPDQDLELSIIHSFRTIRNAFAHGNWQELGQQLAVLRLRDCFEAVSSLVMEIEIAAWESKWAETT
ncbi:hypothetical protein [Pseudoduganella violaceinigra]|uniref:hypothetical protein n=1 Tax=Pseudoduganella violaceinigra TaxID=246602 RepID=UPI00048821C5|nr:hypothetical protein [Pseudoduganella violaceinigra]